MSTENFVQGVRENAPLAPEVEISCKSIEKTPQIITVAATCKPRFPKKKRQESQKKIQYIIPYLKQILPKKSSQVIEPFKLEKCNPSSIEPAKILLTSHHQGSENICQPQQANLILNQLAEDLQHPPSAKIKLTLNLKPSVQKRKTSQNGKINKKTETKSKSRPVKAFKVRKATQFTEQSSEKIISQDCENSDCDIEPLQLHTIFLSSPSPSPSPSPELIIPSIYKYSCGLDSDDSSS